MWNFLPLREIALNISISSTKYRKDRFFSPLSLKAILNYCYCSFLLTFVSFLVGIKLNYIGFWLLVFQSSLPYFDNYSDLRVIFGIVRLSKFFQKRTFGFFRYCETAIFSKTVSTPGTTLAPSYAVLCVSCLIPSLVSQLTDRKRS